jgi:hypothetical protein
MGFNKRIVDIEYLKVSFEKNHPLDKMFKADGLIFIDSVSSEIYKMYKNQKSYQEIKKKFYEKIG